MGTVPRRHRRVPGANERNLISLAETSRPVLGTFAEYSPVYPCLLDGLARSVPGTARSSVATATRAWI